MRISIFASAALCTLLFCSTALAEPVILPSPKLHPGKVGGVELAAPAAASACTLSLRGGERRFGPYPVSLGGPTRIVRWQVTRRASGTWKARLSCRGSGRKGVRGVRHRSLGTTVRKLVVGQRGRPRGRLIARGSLRIDVGSIPEMPVTAQLSISNPFNDDVDTGRRDEPFVRCENSSWIRSTRTTGEGVGTLIQFEPSGLARSNGFNFWTPEADDESNPVYGAMWEDLNRCAHFSADMTDEQRHVMYMQMACHARYGAVSARFAGGNTWDLEAWRANVDWARGLSIDAECGRNYGILDTQTTGNFLVGRIVNGRAYPRANPGEEIKAWLVFPGTPDRPKPFRRHITTLKAYNCLIAAGRAKAAWFPFNFLDTYIEKSGSEIGDTEACSPSKALPAPTPAPGAPGGSKPAAPRPTYYVEQQGSLGANTFTNPYNASGMGVKIPPYAHVEVSCKVYAPQIVSANPDGYWYRIHSSPWNDAYYAVANTFWNGDIPGQKPYVHNTDFAVPNC